MSRPRRFLPPIGGGAQKTGWEALEKWVGGSSQPSGEKSSESAGPSGKTGWEALEKWVGDSGATAAPSAETSAGNGAAAEQPVSASAPSAGPAPESGGFIGFLKRLFSGK